MKSPSLSTSAISVNDLNFSYKKGSETLKSLSFEVEKGNYVALIGHNGSGKSTLAKLLTGLLAADSGEIKIFGEVMSEASIYDIRKQIAIVFQNPDNQFIGSTVRDDIAFGLENLCFAPEKMEVDVDAFASFVGMQEYLDKEPTQLSGGQKQRVAIAGVLAMRPNIIIFDESTSMLDPKGRRDIRNLIMKMRKENPDLTILSITHDIEEAALADEVIILNEGRLYYSGAPKVIFSQPQKLLDIQLDIPFFEKLALELAKYEIDTREINDVDSLVKKLCR